MECVVGGEAEVGQVEVADCIIVLGEVGRVSGKELGGLSVSYIESIERCWFWKTYINLLLQVFLQLEVFDLRRPPCGEVCC